MLAARGGAYKKMTPLIPVASGDLSDIAIDIYRKSEAYFLLREAFLVGAFARGEAARITGLGERTARQVLRLLTDEGLLVSDTPKAPVRLAFSATTATYWLPDLLSK